MNKAALGVILEIAILNPMLIIEVCSTDWIPRVLVSPGYNNYQICALVCRVLSSWLEDPVIREKANLQLVMEVHDTFTIFVEFLKFRPYVVILFKNVKTIF